MAQIGARLHICLISRKCLICRKMRAYFSVILCNPRGSGVSVQYSRSPRSVPFLRIFWPAQRALFQTLGYFAIWRSAMEQKSGSAQGDGFLRLVPQRDTIPVETLRRGSAKSHATRPPSQLEFQLNGSAKNHSLLDVWLWFPKGEACKEHWCLSLCYDAKGSSLRNWCHLLINRAVVSEYQLWGSGERQPLR